MRIPVLVRVMSLVICHISLIHAEENRHESLNFPVIVFISMEEKTPTFSVIDKSFRNVADLASKVNEIRVSDGYEGGIHIVFSESCTLSTLASLVNQFATTGAPDIKFFLSQEESFSKGSFDAGRWVPFSFTIREAN